jgi:hypothetical protein
MPQPVPLPLKEKLMLTACVAFTGFIGYLIFLNPYELVRPIIDIEGLEQARSSLISGVQDNSRWRLSQSSLKRRHELYASMTPSASWVDGVNLVRASLLANGWQQIEERENWRYCKGRYRVSLKRHGDGAWIAVYVKERKADVDC